MSSALFSCALAVTNAAALTNWLSQWRGLCGARGAVPAAEKVAKARLRAVPVNLPFVDPQGASPLHKLLRTYVATPMGQLRALPSIMTLLGGSDRDTLLTFAIGYLGVALLALNMAPAVGALLCWVSYLSLVMVSHPFLGLQMDGNLPETDLLFGLTYALRGYAPTAWLWAQRWQVFRVMLACGMAKVGGGDESWRNGTAMLYHYETQPLPNGLSQFMHARSAAFHAFETFSSVYGEVFIPLLYCFCNPLLRWAGFAATAAFNVAIGATGNYGHLHLMTITEALALIIETSTRSVADRYGYWWLPDLRLARAPAAKSAGLLGGALSAVSSAVGWLVAWGIVAAYVAVSLPPLVRSCSGVISLYWPERVPYWAGLEGLSAELTRYRISNYYSKFTHMTTKRWELQLEGSADGGASWYPFGYVAKPGGGPLSLDETPRMLIPGHRPMFDWRQWFLPLAVQRGMRLRIPPSSLVEGWYRRVELKLLQGEPSVLRLVKIPPELQGRQLTDVRTQIYEYRFSDGTRSMAEQIAQQLQEVEQAEKDSAVVRSTGLPSVTRRRKASSAVASVVSHIQGPLIGGWEVGAVWRRKFITTYDHVSKNDAAADVPVEEDE